MHGADSAVVRDGWDTAAPGGLPEGWRIEATLAGKGGEGAALALWGVIANAGAPTRPHVLGVIRADHGQDQTYNVCWSPTPEFKDGRISVRVQARSGVVDQGGGPMWRVLDRDNYYICRANPLESNFRVYKVVNGVRKQLGSVKVEIPVAASSPGRWHMIEVEHIGDRIVCTLDGGSKLEVTDAELAHAGGVGVWTKADAVAWFDDLRIEPATNPH